MLPDALNIFAMNLRSLNGGLAVQNLIRTLE